MKVNRRLSALWAKRAQAENRQCFRNAWMVACQLRAKGNVHYVEGYAVVPSLPGLVFRHGWVEYRGQIIDPTPHWYKNNHGTQYFPARRWTGEEAYRLVINDAESRVPIDLAMRQERVSPELQEAWLAANKAAGIPEDMIEQMLGLLTFKSAARAAGFHA